ncbi:MAG: hypothetical protein PVF49_03435 [Anaerolineales bacterium]|jgi:hypothetical protein
MHKNRWLWILAALFILMLTACQPNQTQSAPTEEIAQPTEPQIVPTESEEPDLADQEQPCLNPTLGIELTLPSSAWTCEATNDLWLKLTSPVFEVNISNLGRGPFCNPSLDDSCQITPFFDNDIVDLQLYTAGGQPREIFGLAEFSDPEASVWVAITWQDMANHELSEDEITQIQQLVSSISLLGQ